MKEVIAEIFSSPFLFPFSPQDVCSILFYTLCLEKPSCCVLSISYPSPWRFQEGAEPHPQPRQMCAISCVPCLAAVSDPNSGGLQEGLRSPQASGCAHGPTPFSSFLSLHAFVISSTLLRSNQLTQKFTNTAYCSLTRATS